MPAKIRPDIPPTGRHRNPFAAFTERIRSVIIVEPKYENMYAMFEKDSNAKRYFNGLPDYVREQISSRANSVNTYAGLRDYAENLLRGDD